MPQISLNCTACAGEQVHCTADYVESETTFWISCTPVGRFLRLRRIYNSRFWKRCGLPWPVPLLGKKREISMSCILSCIQDRWQGDLQGFKLDQRLLHFISLNIWWICSKFLGRSILPGCWSWPAVLIWEVKDLLERFDRWWMVLTGKKATP